MFLTFLLASILISRSLICLATPMDLTIDLAIDRMVSTGGGVAINLSKFLWKNLLDSFQRCCTTKAGFQVSSFFK